MENNILNLKETDKLEYPVSDSKKDFIGALTALTQYQASAPEEIQKSSFYNETTDGAKLKEIVLANQLFAHCNFSASQLIACKFTNCEFLDCNFSGCSLFNVTFENCKLIKCKFINTVMQDVYAETSYKSNCEFTKIDPDKNVHGFAEEENNIITDQTEVGVFNTVQTCMTTYFPHWTVTPDGQAFEVTFADDDNCGIALYPNDEKNASNEENYWELTLFIGNESIFMSDFNFFGKSAEELKDIITTWKNVTLIENGAAIFKNFITLL